MYQHKAFQTKQAIFFNFTKYTFEILLTLDSFLLIGH